MKRLFPVIAAAVFLGFLLPAKGLAQQKADDDTSRIDELVIASHILENEGILDSFGHASVRSDRNPDHFYMPRAMPPGSVAAGDIVELDMNANPIVKDAPRVNGERFIHSEIYKARPDVQAVVHTHSAAVLPFGLANVPLRAVLVQAGFLPPETPLFEVRDAWGNATERGVLIRSSMLGAALAKTLGDKTVVLLRGHGDAVVGASIREATVRAIYTDINARAQLAALQLNKTITALDGPELAYNRIEQFDTDRPWDNFVRRLSRAGK